jgi:hypothetical protein
MNRELIDEYRYINVEHYDWWEYTEENTKEHLRIEYGFIMDGLLWSGFSSQGDGASFTGAISEFGTLVNKHQELLDVAPVLCKLIRAGKVDLTLRLIRRDSRYAHENTVASEVDLIMTFADIYDDNDSPALLIENAVGAYVNANELDKFENAVLVLLKDEMRKVYRELEAEYDHLISDEAVWDIIVANELHKEEEA